MEIDEAHAKLSRSALSGTILRAYAPFDETLWPLAESSDSLVCPGQSPAVPPSAGKTTTSLHTRYTLGPWCIKSTAISESYDTYLQTQNLVAARSCWFDSGQGHHSFSADLSWLQSHRSRCNRSNVSFTVICISMAAGISRLNAAA
jgi:hypothetical protein